MYIALDIGGTNIRIAFKRDLTTNSIDLLKKNNINNCYTKDMEYIINCIKENSNGENIKGISCSVAGTPSQDRKSFTPRNLSGWLNMPFILDLENNFHCKIVMENDTYMSALGESVYGNNTNHDFLYVTWGTGISFASVKYIDNKTNIYMFEGGHQIIDWSYNNRLCGCGQRGCAEAYIGGGNILKYYGKEPKNLSDTEWNEITDNAAKAIMNAIIFQPSNLIVFGGGIALNNQNRLEDIKELISGRLKIVPVPDIQLTSLGDNVGLLGGFSSFIYK